MTDGRAASGPVPSAAPVGVADLARMEDRISFLYFEHCLVSQADIPAFGYSAVELHAGESEAIVGVDEGLPLVFKCAPRACGDDPRIQDNVFNYFGCSPRMRG